MKRSNPTRNVPHAGCGEDKTVTVATAITLTRTDPRSGRETVERRERRLCRPCGGASSEVVE